MENKEKNLIVDLTFKFALSVVEFTELLEEKRKYVVAKQLLRSGTSIGANVKEAQNASSKKDFLNKMRIAQKEAEETEYWLEICKHSKNYPSCDVLIEELKVILRVINKIVSSTYQKMQSPVL
jgi:four helix bundle protein